MTLRIAEEQRLFDQDGHAQGSGFLRAPSVVGSQLCDFLGVTCNDTSVDHNPITSTQGVPPSGYMAYSYNHQPHSVGNTPLMPGFVPGPHQFVPFNYHPSHTNEYSFSCNAHNATIHPMTPEMAPINNNGADDSDDSSIIDISPTAVTPTEDVPTVQENRKRGRPRSLTSSTEARNNKQNNVVKAKKKVNVKLAQQRDDENFEIAKLRVKYLMEWPEIVDHMNAVRRENGDKESFTDAAVYGRFKRNGPALFVKRGLPRFNPAHYMHLKHQKANLQQLNASIDANDSHMFIQDSTEQEQCIGDFGIQSLQSSPSDTDNGYESHETEPLGIDKPICSIHPRFASAMAVANAALHAKAIVNTEASFWDNVAGFASINGLPNIDTQSVKKIWRENFSEISEHK